MIVARARIGAWLVGIAVALLAALIGARFIHQRPHDWIMLGPPIRSAYPMVVLGTDLPVSAWQRLSVATYKSATDCGDEITTRLVTLHRIPEPYWGEVPELDQMRHARCVAADSIAPTSR